MGKTLFSVAVVFFSIVCKSTENREAICCIVTVPIDFFFFTMFIGNADSSRISGSAPITI